MDNIMVKYVLDENVTVWSVVILDLCIDENSDIAESVGLSSGLNFGLAWHNNIQQQ
jgi:hypothetical protein